MVTRVSYNASLIPVAKLQLPPEAIEVLNKLIKAGGLLSFVVGGFVRDGLSARNTDSADIDIVTELPLAVFMWLFEQQITAMTDKYIQISIGNRKIDIWHSKHLPNHLSVDPLLDDADARDFKINTAFVDVDGNVFDPTGKALKAMADKVLSTVNDADQVLQNDPMIMLRAIYYSQKLTIPLDDELKNAIQKHKNRLLNLDGIKEEGEAYGYLVRLHSKLNDYFNGEHKAGIFTGFLDHGIFQALFPKLCVRASPQDIMAAIESSKNTTLADALLSLAVLNAINTTQCLALLVMPVGKEKREAIAAFLQATASQAKAIIAENRLLQLSFSGKDIDVAINEAIRMQLSPLQAQLNESLAEEKSTLSTQVITEALYATQLETARANHDAAAAKKQNEILCNQSLRQQVMLQQQQLQQRFMAQQYYSMQAQQQQQPQFFQPPPPPGLGLQGQSSVQLVQQPVTLHPTQSWQHQSLNQNRGPG